MAEKRSIFSKPNKTDTQKRRSIFSQPSADRPQFVTPEEHRRRSIVERRREARDDTPQIDPQATTRDLARDVIDYEPEPTVDLTDRRVDAGLSPRLTTLDKMMEDRPDRTVERPERMEHDWSDYERTLLQPDRQRELVDMETGAAPPTEPDLDDIDMTTGAAPRDFDTVERQPIWRMVRDAVTEEEEPTIPEDRWGQIRPHTDEELREGVADTIEGMRPDRHLSWYEDRGMTPPDEPHIRADQEVRERHFEEHPTLAESIDDRFREFVWDHDVYDEDPTAPEPVMFAEADVPDVVSADMTMRHPTGIEQKYATPAERPMGALQYLTHIVGSGAERAVHGLIDLPWETAHLALGGEYEEPEHPSWFSEFTRRLTEPIREIAPMARIQGMDEEAQQEALDFVEEHRLNATPEEDGFFTPHREAERMRRSMAMHEKSPVFGVAYDSLEMGADIATLIAQMKAGGAALTGMRIPRLNPTTNAAGFSAAQSVSARGLYAYSATPGGSEERLDSAINMMAYQMTPHLANATGLVGRGAMTADVIANSVVTMPVYGELLEESRMPDGSINFDLFLQSAIPHLAADIVLARGTRGTTENMKRRHYRAIEQKNNLPEGTGQRLYDAYERYGSVLAESRINELMEQGYSRDAAERQIRVEDRKLGQAIMMWERERSSINRYKDQAREHAVRRQKERFDQRARKVDPRRDEPEIMEAYRADRGEDLDRREPTRPVRLTDEFEGRTGLRKIDPREAEERTELAEPARTELTELPATPQREVFQNTRGQQFELMERRPDGKVLVQPLDGGRQRIYNERSLTRVDEETLPEAPAREGFVRFGNIFSRPEGLRGDRFEVRRPAREELTEAPPTERFTRRPEGLRGERFEAREPGYQEAMEARRMREADVAQRTEAERPDMRPEERPPEEPARTEERPHGIYKEGDLVVKDGVVGEDRPPREYTVIRDAGDYLVVRNEEGRTTRIKKTDDPHRMRVAIEQTDDPVRYFRQKNLHEQNKLEHHFFKLQREIQELQETGRRPSRLKEAQRELKRVNEEVQRLEKLREYGEAGIEFGYDPNRVTIGSDGRPRYGGHLEGQYRDIYVGEREQPPTRTEPAREEPARELPTLKQVKAAGKNVFDTEDKQFRIRQAEDGTWGVHERHYQMDHKAGKGEVGQGSKWRYKTHFDGLESKEDARIELDWLLRQRAEETAREDPVRPDEAPREEPARTEPTPADAPRDPARSDFERLREINPRLAWEFETFEAVRDQAQRRGQDWLANIIENFERERNAQRDLADSATGAERTERLEEVRRLNDVIERLQAWANEQPARSEEIQREIQSLQAERQEKQRRVIQEPGNRELVRELEQLRARESELQRELEEIQHRREAEQRVTEEGEPGDRVYDETHGRDRGVLPEERPAVRPGERFNFTSFASEGIASWARYQERLQITEDATQQERDYFYNAVKVVNDLYPKLPAKAREILDKRLKEEESDRFFQIVKRYDEIPNGERGERIRRKLGKSDVITAGRDYIISVAEAERPFDEARLRHELVHLLWDELPPGSHVTINRLRQESSNEINRILEYAGREGVRENHFAKELLDDIERVDLDITRAVESNLANPNAPVRSSIRAIKEQMEINIPESVLTVAYYQSKAQRHNQQLKESYRNNEELVAYASVANENIFNSLFQRAEPERPQHGITLPFGQPGKEKTIPDDVAFAPRQPLDQPKRIDPNEDIRKQVYPDDVVRDTETGQLYVASYPGGEAGRINVRGGFEPLEADTTLRPGTRVRETRTGREFTVLEDRPQAVIVRDIKTMREYPIKREHLEKEAHTTLDVNRVEIVEKTAPAVERMIRGLKHEGVTEITEKDLRSMQAVHAGLRGIKGTRQEVETPRTDAIRFTQRLEGLRGDRFEMVRDKKDRNKREFMQHVKDRLEEEGIRVIETTEEIRPPSAGERSATALGERPKTKKGLIRETRQMLREIHEDPRVLAEGGKAEQFFDRYFGDKIDMAINDMTGKVELRLKAQPDKVAAKHENLRDAFDSLLKFRLKGLGDTDIHAFAYKEAPEKPQAVSKKLEGLGYVDMRKADLALEARKMGKDGWQKEFRNMDRRELADYVRNPTSPTESYRQLVSEGLRNMPDSEFQKLYDDYRANREALAGKEKREIQREIKKTMKMLKPEYREAVKEMLKGVDWSVQHRKKETIERLQEMEKFLKEKQQDPNAIIHDKTIRAVEILNKKPISEVPIDQMRDFLTAIRQFSRLSEIEEQVRIENEWTNVNNLVERIGSNVSRKHPRVVDMPGVQRAMRKMAGHGMKAHELHLMPEVLAMQIEGRIDGALQQTFHHNIKDGARKEMEHYNHAETFVREAIRELGLSNMDVRAWSGYIEKKLKHVLDVDTGLRKGKDNIKLTVAEVMSLHLHAKHEHNWGAITKGGFKLEGAGREEYGTINAKTLGMKDADFERALENTVRKFREENPVAVALADKMGEFLNTTQREQMNRVSREIIGDDIAKVENYWRLVHPKEAIEALKNFDEDYNRMMNRYMSHRAIEEMGFLQERTGYEGTIRLHDAFAQFNASARDGAKYIGLASPVRTARKVLADRGFVQMMEERGLSRELRYLNDHIKHIEGTRYEPGDVSTVAERGLRNVYASILGANVSIALKQPASLIIAKTELEAEDWAKGMASRPTKRTQDLIRQYSPAGYQRLRGMVHPEMGEIAQIGETARFVTGRQPIQQKLTGLIRGMDTVAVNRIWNAVESEIGRKRPDLRGDEFYQAVARRWEDILDKTQVGGPSYTSSIMRKQEGHAGSIVRFFTMFTSQRNKNYNTLTRSFLRFQQSDKTANDYYKLAEDLTLVGFAQSLLVTAMTSLSQRLRRHHDPEEWFDFWNVMEATASNIYIVGDLIPIMRSYMEHGWSRAFELSTPLADLLTDVGYAFGDLTNAFREYREGETYPSDYREGEEKWPITARRATRELAESVPALMKGLPVGNATRYLEAMAKWVAPEHEFDIDAFFRNPQTSQYYELYWRAIKDDNEEEADRYYNILREEFDATGFDMSFDRRKEQGELDDEHWKKHRSRQIEERRERLDKAL